MSDLSYEIKRLKIGQTKSKKDLMKKIKKCKMSYPSSMFVRFRESIIDIMTVLDESRFIMSPSLTGLRKDMLSKFNGMQDLLKRPVTEKGRCLTRNARLSALSAIRKRRSDDNSNGTHPAFPIWNEGNPGIIRVMSGGDKDGRSIEVYDPGYVPNPFSDFMKMPNL